MGSRRVPEPAQMPVQLSVIFGTFNRLASLKRCVESVRRAIGSLTYEIIVVDGGSTDGTREFLEAQEDVYPIYEAKRRGAVPAFNAGFEASVGAFVALLNDDVEVLDEALFGAVAVLREDPEIGQVALAYRTPAQREFRTYTVHGKPYANLAVMPRRAALEAVEVQGGIWNPKYHTYAADTELSCWLIKLGWRIWPAEHLRCIDHEIQDTLRAENNSGRNRVDSAAFGRKWLTSAHIEKGGPMPVGCEDEVTRYEAVMLRKMPS